MWSWAKWIFGGLMGLLTFCAGVGPNEAASHISEWLGLVGLQVPPWLASPRADTWGFYIGLTGLFVWGVSMLMLKSVAFHGSRQDVMAGTVPSKRLPRAHLKIVCTRISSHSATTFTVVPDTRYDHPCIIELEVTLIPSRPLQIARVSLEVDRTELELLGAPLYADTIQLPKMIQVEETHMMRFSAPPVAMKRQAKLKVFAAGKEWLSRPFRINC